MCRINAWSTNGIYKSYFNNYNCEASLLLFTSHSSSQPIPHPRRAGLLAGLDVKLKKGWRRRNSCVGSLTVVLLYLLDTLHIKNKKTQRIHRWSSSSSYSYDIESREDEGEGETTQECFLKSTQLDIWGQSLLSEGRWTNTRIGKKWDKNCHLFIELSN